MYYVLYSIRIIHCIIQYIVNTICILDAGTTCHYFSDAAVPMARTPPLRRPPLWYVGSLWVHGGAPQVRLGQWVHPVPTGTQPGAARWEPRPHRPITIL